MRRPATPARVAARVPAAQRSLMKGSLRLSPHTPLHTLKFTQLGRNAWAKYLESDSITLSQILTFTFLEQIFLETGFHFADHALVSVLVLRHQRQRRLEKNVEVEQHRPVLDVVEIELDALLDFFFAVDLA